jgi:DNA-binding transcriptional ArsR family regulator
MREPNYPKKQDIELSQVLYALSDPIRLKIVKKLANVEEKDCGSFQMEMPKSSLSHHFKVLRESGVVMSRQEGVRKLNWLRRDDLEKRFPGLLDSVLKAIPQSVVGRKANRSRATS